MTQTKLTLTGQAKPTTTSTSIQSFFPDIHVESYDVSISRSASAKKQTIQINQEDIVLVEFEGEIQWLYTQHEFDQKIKENHKRARGSNTNENELELPAEWNNNSTSRGLLTDALKLIGFNVFKNVSGKPIAGAIAKHIEKNNENILFQCDDQFQFSNQFAAAGSSDKPYLLFIHGTASSTAGSFSGLQTSEGGKSYQTLYKQYDKRILAFEHRTFSESPVKNCMALLKQLPSEITLDIVTHSRGGLVGELLARIADPSINGAFTQSEINALQENDEATDLLQEIKELNTLARKKKINLHQFIRVACPAAGTTLASKRVDTFLNVTFNIMSHIGGEIFGTVVDGIKALIMAVAHEKNNFKTLPGLECMNPASIFIRALNNAETTISSPLTVIAGDAVGEGFFKKLSMFLVDFFYQEDNDLVVNTLSMKKGTPRSAYFPIYDEQRPDVNHFNYFVNASSQRILLQSLQGKTSSIRGFYTSNLLIEKHADAIPLTTRAYSSPKDKAVLYVLPGIMGTHLQHKNQRVWLNYFRMASGQLSRIRVNEPVQPDGINGDAYKEIVDYFSNSHYVVPFGYDWRHSIFDAATELKKHLESTLAQSPTSISFVVHSMGGLVMRAFIVKYPALWQEILKKGNSRVLMLGTPNEGSYDVPYLLSGHGKTIRNVALLDLAHSMKSLLNQFIEYPGLLQLLPKKAADDFSDLSLWSKLHQHSDELCPVPTPQALAPYKEMHEKFNNFKWDATIFKYVAGKDEETPHKMTFDPANNEVNFYSTPYGDGSVTWDSIPIELKSKGATYYLNETHGNLANHESAFKAYKELLEIGHTTLLTQVPAMLRGEVESTLMRDVDAVIMPSEAEISRNIMRIKSDKKKIKTNQIQVSIIHGDMGHARYPVIAGHFEGDAIIHAEQVLNKKLNNYFIERFETNNYPGAIGTHEIVLDASAKPCGGIIVGLGSFGELNENNLAQTIKQALLTYILKQREENSKNPPNQKKNGIGISCLLIGSGFGALTIYNSMKAIMTAVIEANEFFQSKADSGIQLISDLEIIELYQYKAVQASRVLNHILTEGDRFEKMIFKPTSIRRVSGRRNEIPNEMQTDWWHRLKVSEESGTANKATRIIKFSSLTDKARNEEEVLATNIAIVDELVRKAAAFNNANPKLNQTLYELLIPNNFKGYGSDLRNIVLIVDKETARYPWELMQDAHGVNKSPITTRAGFIRQLSTNTYRINPKSSTAQCALIVGNPILENSPYPDLPGARLEAESVNALLSSHYQTLPLIETQGFEVIENLYPNQYKVVHIAAHGVVNDINSGQTGVVLGTNLILTPADFKQMRYVPELVFINCCSLGVIDKELDAVLKQKYDVAAGIGTQLIEMGVRAVIVAGWEVDDAAAQCFSENFYTEMLRGTAFGKAILIARENTYTLHPSKNTWGAYQCYGDPYYCLRDVKKAQKSSSFIFTDPIEAEHALENLLNKLEATTTNSDTDKNLLELTAILKGIELHPSWLSDAHLIEKIAFIYLEADRKEMAIEQFERLFSLENANYSIRAIEQYCACKIKVASKSYRTALETQKLSATAYHKLEKNTIATIDDMVSRLQQLNITQTSERLSLLGSAMKQKARISPSKEIEFLAESANYYFQAYELYNGKYKSNYYYPLINFLINRQLTVGITKATVHKKFERMFKKLANEEQCIQDAVEFAKNSDIDNPNYWNKTAESLACFYQLLCSTNTNEINKYVLSIVHEHEQAWKVEGSILKTNAIEDHIDFVLGFMNRHKAALSKSMKLLKEKSSALQELRQKLSELE